MIGVAKGNVVVASVLVLLDTIRFDPGDGEFGGKSVERPRSTVPKTGAGR